MSFDITLDENGQGASSGVDMVPDDEVELVELPLDEHVQKLVTSIQTNAQKLAKGHYKNELNDAPAGVTIYDDDSSDKLFPDATLTLYENGTIGYTLDVETALHKESGSAGTIPVLNCKSPRYRQIGINEPDEGRDYALMDWIGTILSSDSLEEAVDDADVHGGLMIGNNSLIVRNSSDKPVSVHAVGWAQGVDQDARYDKKLNVKHDAKSFVASFDNPQIAYDSNYIRGQFNPARSNTPAGLIALEQIAVVLAQNAAMYKK